MRRLSLLPAANTTEEIYMYEDYIAKKIVIVLDCSLSTVIALNVSCHLAMAVALHTDGLLGQSEIIDGSGTVHRGIGRYAIVILRVQQNEIRDLLLKARMQSDGLLLIDFPEQMHRIGPDQEMVRSISAVADGDIVYYGFALYGPRQDVNIVTGGLALWKPPIDKELLR